MISPHDIAESYSKLPQDVSSQKLLSEKNIYGSSQLMNMMSLLGKTYFSQVDTSNEEMTQLSNIYYDRSISAAVVEVIPDIKPQNGSSNVFNKQVRMNIDVIGNAVKFISRESDIQAEKSLYHSTGLMSSFYESETLREFTGQRAVSTEEILRVADEQDIDILFLSGANLDELDSSGLSAQNKTDIKKYIEDGNYVTVPAEEITVDSWTGTGYIVYNPVSGMSTYIINNNLHGGSMVSWVGLSYLCDMMLTVVECTWAFDIIMLGATVLGAGLILFTAGPLGIPLALAVSAIGIGAIAAGGLYLKNIGDRFSDATMLMDDYMNGDASAGEKLKTHSLFHGTVMGGGIVVGKAIGVGASKAFQAWSKPNVAPFFKVWIMDKVDVAVVKTFENIPGGVITLTEIMSRISKDNADVFSAIMVKYYESAAPVFNKTYMIGGIKSTEEIIKKYRNLQYYRDITDSNRIVNFYGTEVSMPYQSGKDILKSIDSKLNNPKNSGDLLEAEVANYIINNNLDTIDKFGLTVVDYTNGKKGNNLGDIDIETSKCLIEVKKSISDLKRGQIKKYTDVFDEQFFNFENKKVIVYIDEENINYNSERVKEIFQYGGIIVNKLEDLARELK